MSLRKNMHFSRKLLGTVSHQVVCYPAHDLMFTHLGSDLKKFEKLSFFDFFRILLSISAPFLVGNRPEA